MQCWAGILVLIVTVGCCGFVYPVEASVRVKKSFTFFVVLVFFVTGVCDWSKKNDNRLRPDYRDKLG